MPRDPKDVSLTGQQRQARRLGEAEDQKDPIRLRIGSGPAGAEGKAGSTWYSGTTVPSTGLGAIGDFYLRTTTSDIYKKTAATVWSFEVNIKGSTGSTGATGTNGSTWYSGEIIPEPALGVNGDFYFMSTTGAVYKKVSGSWNEISNLKGATGETGPAGTAAPAVKEATAAALPANTRTANVIEANAVGAWTIDGNGLAVNDLILVKNEATAANNGIYKVVTVGTASVKTKLERDTTMNESAKAVPGMIIYVARGAENADSVWQLITDPTITLNTTALAFAPVSNFVRIASQTTAEITLTETAGDLTGTSFVTPFASKWIVRGYFDWEAVGAPFLLGNLTNGANETLGASEAHTNINGRQISTMEWETGLLAAGTTLKLRARRAGGTSGKAYAVHTRLVAQRVA